MEERLEHPQIAFSRRTLLGRGLTLEDTQTNLIMPEPTVFFSPPSALPCDAACGAPVNYNATLGDLWATT